MPEPSPDRCHACQQPMLHGVVGGRAVWGCGNCNVFAHEDGSGGYFSLDLDALKELSRLRSLGSD